MKPTLPIALCAVLSAVATTTAADIPQRPEFDLTARVKNHRRGAEGKMVEGEEDLRKIILQWDRVADAEEYEVCHQCTVDDATGILDTMGEIRHVPIGRSGECGNRPCLVMPGAPTGYNRFNLRVRVDDAWSAWSVHRNFNVLEPGTIEHEEL
mmetsp:Transcript_13461/g.37159  ORF Transcript_13461/g.37159 Transcript_13461/m.37159 type:complete len:153 (-) Transcript_13461:115-573(-)|eukprot:CAMPEP_0198108220 /NCGR_PEP_ID=MMETSP1442-20131203/293_1 /TAXON_ID= /ORGANISM="Craspedostauros australis, Strain CCMP3328" /LENGTH=152 /DNA_ID=CAMNT_0043763449 /DNA_START=83 /DNA_END=541 /DNA_ORIENTATION=+